MSLDELNREEGELLQRLREAHESQIDKIHEQLAAVRRKIRDIPIVKTPPDVWEALTRLRASLD